MSKDPGIHPEPASAPPVPAEAPGAIGGLALLVYNTIQRNWLSQGDRVDALRWTFARIAACIAQTPELILRVTTDHLSVNGQHLAERSERIACMVHQMKALRTDNIAFKRGLTSQGFENFLEVFTATPDEITLLGGFPKALASCGITHVSCKTAILIEVSEEEIVVQRQAYEHTRVAANRVADVERELAEIADILAHLRGDTAPLRAEIGIVEIIRSMASDARRLAELIYQAASERNQTGAPADGMTTAIVEAVQRTFASLQSDPAAKTQKGQRELKVKMELLERELLTLITDREPPEDRDAFATAIRDAAADASQAVERDALAAEYLRRLRALEHTEKRLLRHVDANPTPGNLRDRLLEEGLPPSQWQALLTKHRAGDPNASSLMTDGHNGTGSGTGNGNGSGTGSGGSGTGLGASEIATAVFQLGELLEHMKEAVAAIPLGVAPDSIPPQLSEIRQRIQTATDDADAKMEALAADIQADATAVANLENMAASQGVTLRLSRGRLLEILREITQELCQPLAVIHSTISMVHGGMLGDTNERQQQMLALAVEGADRLASLLEGLKHLVGVPETMSPDRTLLDQTLKA